MSNTRHSLSLKAAGFILMQNGILAALLFYTIKDATPLETLVILGALSVSAAITIAIASKTLGALKVLADDLSGLADGKADIAERHLSRTDEIGTIARELERVSRENLTRLIEDDEERDARSRQEAEHHERQSRQIDAATNRAKALAQVVESVDGAMRRLASGDLTYRLDSAFPDEFEGLRGDFNHAITSLQEILDRIASSARLLHSTCADAKEDASIATQAGLRQTSAIAKTVADVSALAETLRARKMQTEHTANIAYNARIDMRRPQEGMETAMKAMIAVQGTSTKIEPVAAVIRKIAFEANMLAMNAGIEAAHESGVGGVPAALATDIRALAERATEAAKEISHLSRQSAEAAEIGSRAIGRAESEFDAMTLYMDAVKGHLDTIAGSSAAEIEKVAAVKTSILALAKTGRDQSVILETLATRTDRIMREAGAIDHHAGRFTPVTALTQDGMTIPESIRPPKRGSHLRLVK